MHLPQIRRSFYSSLPRAPFHSDSLKISSGSSYSLSAGNLFARCRAKTALEASEPARCYRAWFIRSVAAWRTVRLTGARLRLIVDVGKFHDAALLRACISPELRALVELPYIISLELYRSSKGRTTTASGFSSRVKTLGSTRPPAKVPYFNACKLSIPGKQPQCWAPLALLLLLPDLPSPLAHHPPTPSSPFSFCFSQEPC